MNNNISRTYGPLIAAVMAPLFLMACGGGDGNSSGVFDAVDSNIALASKGGFVLEADYDKEGADVLLDGSRASVPSWSGNITGDSVTLDFGRERNVSNLRLFTNSVASSVVNADISIEFAANSGAWQTTGYSSGVNVPCSFYSVGSDYQDCDFTSRIQARRIRLTLLSNVGSVALYELEATGY